MTGGKDETVAADPLWIIRIVAQVFLENQIRGRSQADGGTGVTVTDLFHGIGGQYTGRIDGLAV